MERLRMVEADWRTLHDQNEQLIELHCSLEVHRDRLREALDVLLSWASHRGGLPPSIEARARAALSTGPRYWLCPEHGPVTRTDEDGCCLVCGRDCHPEAPKEGT
jgi:hypothetical protein